MKEIWWEGKKGPATIVPDMYKWLAYDEDGECFVYVSEPVKTYWILGFSEWLPTGDHFLKLNLSIEHAPEPGPWHEQLYWIGD